MGSAVDNLVDSTRIYSRARLPHSARATLHSVIIPQHKPIVLPPRCHLSAHNGAEEVRGLVMPAPAARRRCYADSVYTPDQIGRARVPLWKSGPITRLTRRVVGQ
jgi:hypothetical protein